MEILSFTLNSVGDAEETPVHLMMMLSSIKWRTCLALLSFLMLCSVLIKCSKYQTDVQHDGSCTGDFCIAKDEFDEPCMDEGEAPELDEGEANEGLYRWDPIAVSCSLL